jgi:holo-[acyl-carrier protein] synthase
MHHQGTLAALSRMSRKKPEDIETHLSLGSLGVNSSFGLSALRSLIETDTGVRLPPLRVNLTVQALLDLVAQNSGSAAEPVTPVAVASAAPQRPPHSACATATLPRNIGLGMDMQEISTLPATTDFRSHDFYRAHFSAEEIATAMLRSDPRAHLCGVFCAKEAAKKSHPDLLNLRMDALHVSHDSAGKPLLNMAQEYPGRFRFVLSITHTANVAAATCLTLWAGD